MNRSLLRRGPALLAAAALVGTFLLTPTGSGSAEPAAPEQVITLDPGSGGRLYEGMGAISGGGGTSRLLMDYPPKERNEVLDYLFKPQYGASLDILKVEIGGDTHSSNGAEPSHMRAPGQVDCNRGYEWALMKEAKKRNPDISLYGLAWGAPGWFRGGYWSEDSIDYFIKWLDCAGKHHLDIDYMGGRNEREPDLDWYVAFRQRPRQARLPGRAAGRGRRGGHAAQHRLPQGEPGVRQGGGRRRHALPVQRRPVHAHPGRRRVGQAHLGE